jgi:3,4-dihydroxy 2-butanone 4-phosphate synthase/GTP cyclohydrolase II
MHPIPEILDELRAGRMIVLVDDEKRENEGDLVCAAEHATADNVNFMLREGRGMLCVALAGEICDHLELVPQSQINTAQRSTAYTISVDAHERFGVTTGVSAADRARTIAVLIDQGSRAVDLARPGHVQPLRARSGGVLVRAGQTEGSVDLCRLAGLEQGGVIIEIMNEDGTMAREPQLRAFCAGHGMKMCSVADVIEHRMQREKLIERLDEVPFESEHGSFRLMAIRSVVDPLPHVVMACGDVGRLDSFGRPVPIKEPVLVRMHSQNLFGDVFGDVQQRTGRTLAAAMRTIHAEGRGAVVYLRHEMSGHGLLQRLHTLHPPIGGGPQEDERVKIGRGDLHPSVKPASHQGAYGIGCQILRHLGITRLRLITDHPFHPTALGGFGLEICEFVPVGGDDE